MTMKISMVSFKIILGVTFLMSINLVCPGDVCAQELIMLPTAYEEVFYSCQLKKKGLYPDQKWVITRGKQEWMTLTASGQLYGIPVTKKEGKGEEYQDFEVKVTSSKPHPCKNKVKLIKTSIFRVKLLVRKFPRWDFHEDYRTIFGCEYSGASSASHNQKFFFDLYLSNPLPLTMLKKKCYSRLGQPFKIWGDIKFTSLPQQINVSLVKVPDEFLDIMKSMEINEITRSIEFSGGFDCRIDSILLRSGNKILSISIIGAYGGSTPCKPDDSVLIYKLPTDQGTAAEIISELKKKYGEHIDLEGKEYVAFANADRKRFFRQCYLGFRIKTYTKPRPVFKDEKQNKIVEGFDSQFPSIFELTLGRNDFIVNNDFYELTGSDKKKLLVLTLGGILPIRVRRGVTLYLFGTAMMHFNKRIDEYKPIILEPAPEYVKFTDAKVGRITFYDESRDYYRFGVGIELSNVVEGIFKKLALLF